MRSVEKVFLLKLGALCVAVVYSCPQNKGFIVVLISILNFFVGHWIFNNLLIKGPLTVGGTISGIDLKHVYDRALKVNDTVVQDVIFNNYVEVRI